MLRYENVKFYLSFKIVHQYIFHLPSFSLWPATFRLPWFGKWHILVSQIFLKLWLIGKRTEWSPIRSVIILVIKQIGLPLRGRPILLITRMITDRIGLHSVLLPLLIMFFNKRLNCNVWLTYQHLDPTVEHVYCFPRVDLGRSTMQVFRGKYPVVEKLNGSRRW